MAYHVRAYSGTDGVPGKVYTHPDWMLTERLSVRDLGNDCYRVSDMDGFRGTDVEFTEDGRLFFNGEFVDVGDDFPAFLGLMDEIAEIHNGIIEPDPDAE